MLAVNSEFHNLRLESNFHWKLCGSVTMNLYWNYLYTFTKLPSKKFKLNINPKGKWVCIYQYLFFFLIMRNKPDFDYVPTYDSNYFKFYSNPFSSYDVIIFQIHRQKKLQINYVTSFLYFNVLFIFFYLIIVILK